MSAAVELVKASIHGHTDEAREERVLELLRRLDPAEWDELLDDDVAHRLLATIDDHLFGPDNHRELLQLLDQRKAALSVRARSSVIHALQMGWTGHDEECLAADLLCGAMGAQLTDLKNSLNMRTDGHDLEGLVYNDIDDESLRARVLQHISDQARGHELPEAKVLSDIDDTVFCKLHDKRYPKGTLYPGVLAFQQALDRGPEDNPHSAGDLTFVTARPKDIFGLIAGRSRESLTRAGVADLTIMSGSFHTLLTLGSIARKKVTNVDHYAALFPEYRLTFMGDSGQSDVRVGERLWQLHPTVMDAVFIHDVVDTPQAERRRHAEHNVWFHDTYVGAANKALELGLVSRTGRDAVVQEALEELDEVAWDSPEQEQQMRALFERDIAARA